MKVFPNPASESISINKQGGIFFIGDKISITNFLGQVLYTTQITKPTEVVHLNLKELSSGILTHTTCFITLQTGKSIMNQKLIIN